MDSNAVNARMMIHLNDADEVAKQLSVARESNDACKIHQLEREQDAISALVNELWDLWNDCLLRERLARI